MHPGQRLLLLFSFSFRCADYCGALPIRRGLTWVAGGTGAQVVGREFPPGAVLVFETAVPYGGPFMYYFHGRFACVCVCVCVYLLGHSTHDAN